MTEESKLFADKQTQPADDQQQKSPESTQQPTPGTDQGNERLSSLEKRFNDSQSFIDQLKTENAEMREELQKRLTAEQVLEHVKSNDEQAAPATPAESELNLDAISDLVKNQVTQTMSEAEAAKTVSQNQEAFTKALIGQYGEKAEEVYKQVAGDAGLTPADLDKLVGKSAVAGLKMFGLDKPKVQSTAPSTGTVTTGQPLSPQSPVDSRSHWEKVRKENPSYYYSQKGQSARWASVKKAGADKFNQS